MTCPRLHNCDTASDSKSSVVFLHFLPRIPHWSTLPEWAHPGWTSAFLPSDSGRGVWEPGPRMCLLLVAVGHYIIHPVALWDFVPQKPHVFMFYWVFLFVFCFLFQRRDLKLHSINLKIPLSCPSFTKSNLCLQWILPSGKNTFLNFPAKVSLMVSGK